MNQIVYAPRSRPQSAARIHTGEDSDMSKTKHTQGPWKADKNALYIWAATERGDFTVAQIRGWGHLTGKGGLALSDAEAFRIQKANACLLAAAPDLLYALQAFVGYYEQAGITGDEVGDDDDGQFDGDEKFNVRQARTAIAKAVQKD
jgi:hypothetical protein